MAEMDAVHGDVPPLWVARSEQERATQLLIMGVALATRATRRDLDDDPREERLKGILDEGDPLVSATPLPGPLTEEASTRSLDWLRRAALGRPLRRAGGTGPARKTSVELNEGDELPFIAQLADRRTIDHDDAERLLLNIDKRSSARAAIALLTESLRDPAEEVRAVAAAILQMLGRTQDAVVLQTLAETVDSANDSVLNLLQYVGDTMTDSRGLDASQDGTNKAALTQPTAAMPDTTDDTGGPDDERTEAVGARESDDEELDKQEDGDRTTSIMVHGTFARLTTDTRRWYDPHSDFSGHVRGGASDNLFAGRDYVRWSGHLTDQARSDGTHKLLRWCERRSIEQLDTVYAHSHGGNVVLDAIEAGLKAKLLVLLHVPVIDRTEQSWATIEQNVGRILDLRTARDWVVTADRLWRAHNKATPSRNYMPDRPWIENPRGPVFALEVSHVRYVQLDTWESLRLCEDVRDAWDAV
ncbi:hypothetical protein [Curtobacterium sp. 20TX0008]|uniref:hypothetical protein n=1 Tax=Curtobacterium sp. 20TX0008 TaxID=3022018 RepID=UPI00232F1850|nr:hypothetical protein [Curtobacterium sp. 20TX0008]MDB6427715.1 hypothetical protein [Curtobacterium sp. 20TX0008]